MDEVVNEIVSAAIDSISTVDVLEAEVPRVPLGPTGRFRWDTWPRLHDPERVHGPDGVPFAWIATATSTVISDGFPVHAVGTEQDVRDLVLVVLTHSTPGIPVMDFMGGRMRRDDWPRLSKQVGRVVSLLAATHAEQPLTISPWLPTGRRTIAVADPGTATVRLDVEDDVVHSGHRAIAMLDRPGMRVMPLGSSSVT